MLRLSLRLRRVLVSQVTDDGKPDPKCVALFEALDNLQIALTGSVQTPTAAAAAVTSLGPGGGASVGQTVAGKSTGNNGCWPYN